MTIFSKNFGGHGPFGPPGYAYVIRHWCIWVRQRYVCHES